MLSSLTPSYICPRLHPIPVDSAAATTGTDRDHPYLYECPVYKTARRQGEVSSAGSSSNFVLYLRKPVLTIFLFSLMFHSPFQSFHPCCRQSTGSTVAPPPFSKVLHDPPELLLAACCLMIPCSTNSTSNLLLSVVRFKLDVSY